MMEITQSEIAAGLAMDEFKLVDGIGPAVEKRLHTAGIRTYAELARLEPAKLANLLDGMVGYSPKRIKEQDWSGQARSLAERTEQSLLDENHARTNNSMHYASYTVELLLDRENKVRRTRAVHVQSRQEGTWAGWDVGRLRDFLVERGQLQIASAQAEGPVSNLASSTSASIEPFSPAPGLKGSTKIIETRLLNKAGQPLGAIIPCNTPFVIQLMLDLSRVKVPKGDRLGYDAAIFLKKIGKSERNKTGEKKGSFETDKSAVIDVNNHPLPPGDYRLEGLVALGPHSQPKRLKNQMMAMTESMLLHVV